MPSIAWRHNYRRIVIDNKGEALDAGVTHNFLPVLLPDGSEKFVRSGGFISSEHQLQGHEKWVGIIQVEAWTQDDDGMIGWQNLPARSSLLGVFNGDTVQVVLDAVGPVSLGKCNLVI